MQMDMETFKKKVRDCLINEQNCTIQHADELIKKYDDDFPELWGWNLDPLTASGFTISGLY